MALTRNCIDLGDRISLCEILRENWDDWVVARKLKLAEMARRLNEKTGMKITGYNVRGLIRGLHKNYGEKYAWRVSKKAAPKAAAPGLAPPVSAVYAGLKALADRVLDLEKGLRVAAEERLALVGRLAVLESLADTAIKRRAETPRSAIPTLFPNGPAGRH
jgi:hypothetical protein